MNGIFIDGDGNEDWIKEVTRKREAGHFKDMDEPQPNEQDKQNRQEPKQ